MFSNFHTNEFAPGLNHINADAVRVSLSSLSLNTFCWHHYFPGTNIFLPWKILKETVGLVGRGSAKLFHGSYYESVKTSYSWREESKTGSHKQVNFLELIDFSMPHSDRSLRLGEKFQVIFTAILP